AIREALKPRVDLPSGGYIIIEPTEALTVVDVNSGSFTRSATARETVLWTNCEAAAEIARQLRLRNVAGVIIVDFIDMDSRRDQLQVLEHFSKALRADKARPQISQLSELGLVELTRKRQGQNIYELFSRPCPTCDGLGHLVHLPGEKEKHSANPEVAETSREYKSVPSVQSSTATLPAPKLDSRADDLEPHADLQELELMNHPSYQEKGGTKGNNRHRRRRRPADSLPNRNARESEREVEPVENKNIDEQPELAESSKPSKTKSNGRHERKQPAEVISVEMTPEEQKVYAMMGISPLVLANQDIKDPRSAIISVVLPGERATTSEPKLKEPIDMPKSVAAPKKSVVASAESEPILATQVADEEEAEAEMPVSATGTEDNDSENENGIVRRRRRRRSSAETATAEAN
ncbi:ribonuclease E/G, partial [Almyronema epifaneia]